MKKETVNGIVNAHIKSHLSPKPTERDMVSREYEALCGFVGDTCFQSGSFARFTSTTPVNDLDVIWRIPDAFLDSDVLRKMAEPNKFDPSAVLNKLAQNLRESYLKEGRQVRIVPQSHSVGIYFGKTDDEFSIDLVPAIAVGRQNEYGYDIYWVPEIAELSKSRRAQQYASGRPIDWLLSDPRGYIEDARELNDSNDNFRKVSKFLRKWRRGCKRRNPEFRLKSFHTELIVNDIFKRNPGIDTVSAIIAFFDTFGAYFVAPSFPDRADSTRHVDGYISSLTQEERNDVNARVRAGGAKVHEMLDGAVTEDDVRRVMGQVLDGNGIGSGNSSGVSVAAASAVPATSFHPQRSYASDV